MHAAALLRTLIYSELRRYERAERYARDVLTPLGRWLLSLGFAAALFGFDTRLNALHQLFALALALLLLAALMALLDAWRLRGRVTAHRKLPATAVVGTAIDYRVCITCAQRRPLRGLELSERLPDPIPTRAQFRDPRQGADPADGWFDRLVGYPRWRRLIERQRVADPGEPVALPGLGQRTTCVRLRLTPTRRGYLHLPGFWLTRADPFGLLRARVKVPGEQRLLVLPRRYPTPRLVLPGRRHYQPGGLSLAAKVGDSQDIIGLREYRPGDSPRQIHWPSWARTGTPQVKEYQEEFFTRHALALDTFAPAEERIFEAAVSVAASLCDRIGDEDSLLDLLFVGNQTYCFTGGRGLGGSGQFLEILACVEPCPNASVDALRHALLARVGQLSALVLILLTFDSARRTLVSACQRAGLPLRVLVITTVSAAELNADWPGPPVSAIHPERLGEDLARL